MPLLLGDPHHSIILTKLLSKQKDYHFSNCRMSIYSEKTFLNAHEWIVKDDRKRQATSF